MGVRHPDPIASATVIGLRALLVFWALFLCLHGIDGSGTGQPDAAVPVVLAYLGALTVIILAFAAILVLPPLLMFWCIAFFPLRWVNVPDRVAALVATGLAAMVSPILVMFWLALDPDNWEKPEPWSGLTSVAWTLAAVFAAITAWRVFTPRQFKRP
jgi:hypothetical protein